MTVVSRWMERREYLLRLELPSSQFYRDEPLVGTARVKSVSAKLTQLRDLRASIWSVGSDDTPHLATELTLFERETLGPMETRTFPFALRVPHDLLLGNARVRLSLKGGLLQYLSAPAVAVKIAPEKRLAALVELASEIARHEIESWGAATGGSGFNAHLKPKAELEERIWNIGIDMRPEGDAVVGSILVMPRHPDIIAAIRSAAQLANCVHPFRLPASDMEAARIEFERILLPYVNDLKGLPIPARPSTSVDCLPLPGAREAEG